MNTQNITPMTKANVKEISSELKAQGIACSRPDGLRLSLAAMFVIEGFNYRAEDPKHIEQLVIAFANGSRPAPFIVQPHETDNGTRYGVIGGHHTRKAIQVLTELNNNCELKGTIQYGEVEFTKEMLKPFKTDAIYNAEAVFPKNANEAKIMAFNHNQGKKPSVIENARFFKGLLDDGMDLAEIVAQTGNSKSVICNTVKLLDGDNELLNLVETGAISATKARTFINKHGAEKATEWAKAEINLKNGVTVPADDNNAETTTQEQSEVITGDVVTTENTTRLAAKNHAVESGLKTRKLTESKVKELEVLITQIAKRMNESGVVELPEALQGKVVKLSAEISAIDEHNNKVIQQAANLS
ncbi:hypothetical protein [Vibrio sp. R78045]|uniref:hypothetical protein n=1 Tax=Vibrio sp. R78045 TaxID=3093868 RepID=UPI0036F2EB9B